MVRPRKRRWTLALALVLLLLGVVVAVQDGAARSISIRW